MSTFEYEELYFYFDNWKNYAKYQNVASWVASALFPEINDLDDAYYHEMEDGDFS